MHIPQLIELIKMLNSQINNIEKESPILTIPGIIVLQQLQLLVKLMILVILIHLLSF